MSVSSSIAVYFIVWWLCLFMILPIGIRNAHEAGEAVETGNDAGAPVNPMLWRKVWQTTLLSFVVFGLVWGQVRYGWIGFDDIPFLGAIGKG